MIFGAHVSRPEKGFRTEAPPPAPGYLGNRMFCHSAASWAELWDGEVFEKGTVRVEAVVVGPTAGGPSRAGSWSQVPSDCVVCYSTVAKASGLRLPMWDIQRLVPQGNGKSKQFRRR